MYVLSFIHKIGILSFGLKREREYVCSLIHSQNKNIIFWIEERKGIYVVTFIHKIRILSFGMEREREYMFSHSFTK
jgi:hypothetical protein